MTLWPDMAQTAHSLRYVQAGPVRTRCLEAGGGEETLIFLHGVGGHLEAYLRNIPALAQRYRVVAFDFIGHGYTDKPDRPYEVADYVQHLREVCDALGVERAHLSGASLGGWVAARFAYEQPERVGKLVLNTAGGLYTDRKTTSFFRGAVEDAAMPTRDAVRKRIEWLMHDASNVTEDLVEMRYRIYCLPGFAAAMANIMCLQDWEIRQRNLLKESDLARIEAPTLVLWTTEDPAFPIEVGEKFRDAIPRAELVVMEGCGHWPHFEDAATFNTIHQEFLGR